MESTFLTSVRIRSVRHLKNIDIPLSCDVRKNLILTGKNGSGKTSVLNALVDHLRLIVSDNRPSEEKCREKVAFYEKELSCTDDTESGLEKYRQYTRHLSHWKQELDFWEKGVAVDCTSHAALKQKYSDGKFILAYFEDNRRILVDVSENIVKVTLWPVYSILDQPSRELVKYLTNLKATQAFAQAKGDVDRFAEIESWFERFQNILRRIYDDTSLVLDFDIDNFQFSIHINNREPFDFNTMSMGYAAVFDIIGNLIMRMESQHSYDLEGVVLIDEIETHLHVDLQKKIVPILTELFPNLQFILTTHSPFVLNSAKNAVVYDLENHTFVENGLTGLPYEGIVEGYFGVNRLSQELEEKFKRYKQIIGKAELSDEDYVEAAELEQYLDELPDYLSFGFAAEYSRLKLEFANRG